MPTYGESYKGITRNECVTGLDGVNEGQKLSVIKQVGDLGPSGSAYLQLGEEMAKQLNSSSTAVQLAALVALGRMGEEALHGASRVVALLSRHSSNTAVASAAITALGGMGERAAEFALDVLPFASSADEHVATEALVALGRMNVHKSEHAAQCDEVFLKCLRSEVSGVACAACNAWASRCEDSTAFSIPSEIIDLLGSQDPRRRRAAMACLAKSGQSGLGHKEAACKCLGDEDPVVRCAAVEFFADKAGSQGLAQLVQKALSSQVDRQKCAAAVALGHLGEKASATEIASLLNDGFVDSESARLYASCVIEKPPTSMRFAKCAACFALSKLGEEGAKFSEKIVGLLEGPSEPWEVREAALLALGDLASLGCPIATEAEVKALERIADTETPVECAAMLAMGQMCGAMGCKSAESETCEGMTRGIVTRLASSNPVVRASAAKALSNMGQAGLPYLDRLVKRFQEDRCPSVKAAAMLAFTKFGKAGQVYAPAIAAMLSDESPTVRVAAIESVALMGERGAALVDEIAEYLEDPEGSVRAAAAAALGKFGTAAGHYRDYLEAMRQEDSIQEARVAAEQSLALIA